VGSSIIILRYLGKKDSYTANHVFAQALFMGVLLSVLVGIFWYYGGTQIFRFIHEDSDIARTNGTIYLRTIALFAPIIILNFISIGIVRSVGNTLHTMTISVIGNIVNLILAPFLIFGWWVFPRLEVQGAAYAVIVAQMVSFSLIFYFLRSKKLSLFLPFSEFFAPKLSTFIKIIKLGLPTTIEQFVWAAGQLILSIYVAKMGVIYLALHQIFVRIQSILTMFYYGLGTGSMSMIGKFIGGMQFKKLNRTAIISAASGLTLAITIGLIIYLGRMPLLRLFTSDPEVISLGYRIIFILCLVQFPKAANIVFSNNLRAAADNNWLMILAVSSVLTFEISLSYILTFSLGLYLIGIWLIQGIDEFTRLILNNIRFFRHDWEKISKQKDVMLHGE
jgi:putative MATE family efflux protein